MKKISGSTWYIKIVFPCLFLGFSFLFIIIYFSNKPETVNPIIITPIIMAAIFTLYCKRYIWDLYDDVYDEVDTLVFKRKNETKRVNIIDIVNINYTENGQYPERIIITIKNGNHPLQHMAFIPPFRINRFGMNPIVSDLLNRIK
ncbi:hypothetical protein LCE44_27460 [Vibrio harveyi]|uniref:hypothetical protein n=1 Tax=Vibrio harveyi TaxID=669 RepID=UPI003BF6F89A